MMGKAMQCGFLGMIFLVSGTSALQCYSSTYFWNAVYKGDSGFSIVSHDNVNCSNACMEAQLKLSVAESVLLATYRGCADEERKDGQGDVTTDNPHFIMQYNESYCSRDLCNRNMSLDYVFNLNPEENTAPEESGSNHCYAGITFNSKENLKGVTCSKGYEQCYSGQARVKAGFFGTLVFIKTCSRPNSTESQTLSFGPIEIKQSGSTCLGSYCNGETNHGKETVVTCWFSFFSLCAISLGGALLY